MLRMPRCTIPMLLAVGGTVGLADPCFGDVEVTACGQEYSGPGVLVTDLDCSGTGDWAVRIVGHGSLDLAGHTLTADHGVLLAFDNLRSTIVSSLPGGALLGTGVAGSYGVFAEGNGQIAGVRAVSVSGFETCIGKVRNLRVDDSTIGGCLGDGITGDRDGKTIVRRSSVISNGGSGIAPHPQGSLGLKVTLIDSTVADNGSIGVVTSSLKVVDSTIDGNGSEGTHAGIQRLKRCSVSGNGQSGIFSTLRLRASACDISNNGGAGIERAENLRVRGSTINANGRSGIELLDAPVYDDTAKMSIGSATEISGNTIDGVHVDPGPVVLRMSGATATANGTDPECGSTIACADLATASPPTVGSSASCDRSLDTASGFPGASWGVCDFD